jgi:hypothetical protein
MSDELFTTKTAAPVAKEHEVRAVVAVLRKHQGWLTAREIAAVLGGQGESFERKVRVIAGVAAPTVVSYPGSPGYCFWNFCTVEEIERCIDAFDSQGRDMIRRGNVYRLAYYRRHREPIEVAVEQQPLALA